MTKKKNYIKLEVWTQKVVGNVSHDGLKIVFTGPNSKGTPQQVEIDVGTWAITDINRQVRELLVRRFQHQQSEIKNLEQSVL